MQYMVLAVSAFVAAAAAADTTSINTASVLSVLQTALPSSLVNEALTNFPAVSSKLASEFEAGQTPTWFTALPSNVQTYLEPLATESLTTRVPPLINATTVSTNGTSLRTSTGSGTLSTNSANSTTTSTDIGVRPTPKTTDKTSARTTVTTKKPQPTTTTSRVGGGGGAGGSSSASSTTGTSTTASSGLASLPTAFVGAGIAGVVGVVGLLAL